MLVPRLLEQLQLVITGVIRETFMGRSGPEFTLTSLQTKGDIAKLEPF